MHNEVAGRELLDALDEPVAVLDAAFAIEFANPRYLEWPAVVPPRVASIVSASGGPPCYIERLAGRWAEISLIPLPASRTMVHVRDADERVGAVEEAKRLRLRVLTIQEDERRVISQNLHDELGQGMTALGLTVSALARGAEDPDLAASLREVRSQVETITKRMRQLFYRLRPPGLREESLTVALADYSRSVAHAAGIPIEFDADSELPELDGAAATALYRLLQEAVNNALKHAGAAGVWVGVDHDEERVTLTVEDDGSGFDPSMPAAGMGLVGLRERFRMLDGELSIDSGVGRGTRITGTVPVLAPVLAPVLVPGLATVLAPRFSTAESTVGAIAGEPR